MENINIEECEKIEKKDYVLHLASKAPHKKTGQLLKWWKKLQKENKYHVPELKLVGELSSNDKFLLEGINNISPRLNRKELIGTIKEARSLILPSEIEGFGLPAIEAFYVGTPVCYVADTSVDEILNGYHQKGKFHLNDISSFKDALDHTMNVGQSEALEIGKKLRTKYSNKNLVKKVTTAFYNAVGKNVSMAL